jgi:hypothetical protein
MRVKSSLLLLSVVFGLAACGGSQESPKDASSEAGSSEASDEGKAQESDAPKKDEAPGDKAEDTAAKAEPKKEEKAEASDTSMPKVKRTPKDIVTAPDVIFMFSFNNSDIKEQFEKQCDAQAKDNPKKRADCMSKAKDKLEWDGMRFKQEKGSWYWSMIKVKGKTLVYVHKLPIEFGKEDDHSIVVKPSGKDEGKSPKGAPGETKIEVPNEYEIVVQDPKLGKAVYEAKIGLTEGK